MLSYTQKWELKIGDLGMGMHIHNETWYMFACVCIIECYNKKQRDVWTFTIVCSLSVRFV